METEQSPESTPNSALTHILHYFLPADLLVIPALSWSGFLVEMANVVGHQHAGTQWHIHIKMQKHDEPLQANGSPSTDCRGIQTSWSVALPLLPIIAHLFWLPDALCHWEVRCCWCLQQAFEMLQEESLGLWKCTSFKKKKVQIFAELWTSKTLISVTLFLKVSIGFSNWLITAALVP